MVDGRDQHALVVKARALLNVLRALNGAALLVEAHLGGGLEGREPGE